MLREGFPVIETKPCVNHKDGLLARKIKKQNKKSKKIIIIIKIRQQNENNSSKSKEKKGIIMFSEIKCFVLNDLTISFFYFLFLNFFFKRNFNQKKK